ESINKKNVHVTSLPKKTEAGNPDFRVWDGKQHIVGYIEAKAPTIEYLDQIETTEQIKRYRNIFPNLILTNFFEFRLYRNGDLIDKASIARPFVMHKLKTIPPIENESDFFILLEKFFSFSLPKVYNAKTLAIELAKRTRFLKDEVVTEELKEEESQKKGFIVGFYEAFKQYLISGLTREDFADLYSQTITYGLFVARTRSENSFNRKLAYDNIPHTIGILREVFQFISLGDLPKPMEWIIDDISEVLAVTDVKNILHQYFHEGKGKDPVVHFYETFLAEYDPQTREKRGVYYTPEPVVSYIVRSLHHILKEHFNRADGFASESVTVLDPAAGTLTFLAEAAKCAVEEFALKYGKGGKEKLLREQILKNFYAFELMMAPYAVGHLKMSFLLEELGYRLGKEERFKLYLTNTLEMDELAQTALPGMSSLSEESHLAGKVKKQKPILVILGNPPYSGHSANVGEWISREIKAYYQVDGKPLGEKNPKWLQDDYVKFIRFAQWKIDQAGEGVLGFITNHSYLDNPTFRGMRQSLIQSFDEIYVLDLHGNSLKKEKCPDGSKDENVFDIRQGVAIALFIKTKKRKKECKVNHSEIWGLREAKYDWLLQNDLQTATWKKLSPRSEFYLFVPRDEGLLKAYQKYLKITDVFPLNSVGIVTARDSLTIKWSRNEVWNTVLNFSKMDAELARSAYSLGKDARDWKVELAQNDLSELDKNKIVPILYRPFDKRYTYYTGKSRGFLCRPRPEVMRHMIKNNLGLVFHKREELLIPYSHFLVTTEIVEHGCLSSKTTCYLAPLYLYSEKNNPGKLSTGGLMMLFEPKKDYEARKPNISPGFIEQLTKNFKKTPSPEQIFFYIYAVLYSNTYRTKYAEFLKTDFPRIPFTGDYKLFIRMGEHGKGLVDLHLLKSSELDSPVSKLQGKGDYKVEKVKYEKECVYINNDQCFEGVKPEVWQYQVGGYQVCDKWLKDRKGRTLSLEEIKTYCKVVTALQKTIETQKAIDNLYSDVEKEIFEFKQI
ncbi:MAG TPA: N-6 DNA methylase, partial [Thermodesulfobacteriota bacterium]|nr:N-6 DNA methylase [Thermodesulfobacteriota bacterium]